MHIKNGCSVFFAVREQKFNLLRIYLLFLNENHSSIQKESEKKEPSFVMLTDELSDEEITSEVRRFRLKHQNAKIVLYDNHDDMISAMNNRKMSANRKYKTNRQA